MKTTTPDQSGRKFPDLVGRDFTAESPNLRYVGDITSLPIADGTNLFTRHGDRPVFQEAARLGDG